MALPSTYLTSVKNLAGILNSIVGAQAPKKFTTRFLESLGYKSNSDRLIIGVLKSLGFLADDGHPTPRYYEYLDQSRSAVVMAQAITDAYADLFQINRTANTMSKTDVVNKFKTLSQGQSSASVLSKMAMTFTALCKYADFDAPAKPGDDTDEADEKAQEENENSETGAGQPRKARLSIGGLVYNIQLMLPESRDPKVYDALFEALWKHLS